MAAGALQDFYAPDVGQRMDALGRVTYEFSGHVTAAGLDLLADDSHAPRNDRRLRWTRQSDGLLVAELVGWTFDGIPAEGDAGVTLTSRQLDRLNAQSNLAAIDNQGQTSSVSAFASAGSGSAIVATTNQAGWPQQQKTILRYDGSSSYWMRGDPLFVKGVDPVVLRGALGAGFNGNVRIDGPYSVGVPALAQNGVGSAFVNAPVDSYVGAGAGWIPVGYFINGTGYANFWSATRSGVNQLRFDFACPWPGGQPAGTFAFFLVGWL